MTLSPSRAETCRSALVLSHKISIQRRAAPDRYGQSSKVWKSRRHLQDVLVARTGFQLLSLFFQGFFARGGGHWDCRRILTRNPRLWGTIEGLQAKLLDFRNASAFAQFLEIGACSR